MNQRPQGVPSATPTVEEAAAGVAAPPPARLFDSQNCRSLYIGGLSNKINEALLYDIFSTAGPVESCKLIKDKNTGEISGYGFVDFVSPVSAQNAMASLNGRTIYDSEIKVNWAFAAGHKEDTSGHHHIFVGDLSPEINDKALQKAFSAFGSISDARVMWDQQSGRSRGYGFVAFKLREDAERALTEMNGEWLGSRNIRCNWASQKTVSNATATPSSSSSSSGSGSSGSSASNSAVDPNVTTVYFGNLSQDVTEAAIRAAAAPFGVIEELRPSPEKGYAFVKYSTHESARNAIAHLAGVNIGSKPVKISWGRERTVTPVVPQPHPLHMMQQQAYAQQYAHPYSAYHQYSAYQYPYAQQQYQQYQQQHNQYHHPYYAAQAQQQGAGGGGAGGAGGSSGASAPPSYDPNGGYY